MAENFGYKMGKAKKALCLEGYYVWDSSVIKTGGKYHMFASRWPKELGFGVQWLYNSEVVHCVSDTPEGPYEFKNVVLKRRGRQYFDGMNTHNPCIKEHNGKFYLYYMGTTYSIDIPDGNTVITPDMFVETWNRKRIGVAVADSVDSEFSRKDSPLLDPRGCEHWDCTVTTNPTVAILPSGKTYMIYKSRRGTGLPLRLGVTVADSPDGEFKRLSDNPILQFENDNYHIEDPYLWYDDKKKKFCLIAKDDVKNGSFGITGEWGSGFYAESDDCINFEIPDSPKVYSRDIIWEDGKTEKLCNLERPSLLFDEQGNPTHLFCASGEGDKPYEFTGDTFVVCIKLEKNN